MSSRRNICLLVALIASVPCLQAQSYNFSKIVETGPDSQFSLVLPVAMSPNGTVLFGGVAGSDLTKAALYTSSGGVITKVLDGSAERVMNAYGGDINSAGQIVIYATLVDGTTGVFSLADGKLTPIYKVDGLAGLTALDSLRPRINERGAVVFTIRSYPTSDFQGGGAAVVLSEGGTSRRIADQATNFAGFRAIMHAGINNNGRIAFAATDLAGKGGLTTWDSGTFSVVVPETFPAGFALALSDSPSINDSGAIAFKYTDASQVSGIRVYRPGAGTQLVASDSSEPRLAPFREVRHGQINNAGTVAFHAQEHSRTHSIYTVTGGVRTKVIGAGDSLFGSAIAGIDENSPDRGSRSPARG